MAGFVGGDTELVGDVGKRLSGVAARVGSVAQPFRSAVASAASGAAGNAATDVALDRCGAVWSRILADLATQIDAVGVLAGTGAADLEKAGES